MNDVMRQSADLSRETRGAEGYVNGARLCDSSKPTIDIIVCIFCVSFNENSIRSYEIIGRDCCITQMAGNLMAMDHTPCVGSSNSR